MGCRRNEICGNPGTPSKYGIVRTNIQLIAFKCLNIIKIYYIIK